MRSRLLVNLVLLGIVALLAAVAFFEPALDAAPEAPTITALQPKDVATLRVVRSDGTAVGFARRDGLWWMVEPVEVPASDYRVQSVLNIAQSESLARYPAADTDLAALGLAPPEVRIIYNGSETISVGAQTAIDQRRYVQVGDQVHLIGGTSYYQLIGHYASFADSTLLPPGARINALQLPGLELVQQDGRWRATPEPADFSVDAVNQLLDHWRHTRALQVVKHEARPGREKVRVTLADGEPVTFAVVAREPELVLARPALGLEYRLTTESAERLFKLAPTADPES